MFHTPLHSLLFTQIHHYQEPQISFTSVKGLYSSGLVLKPRTLLRWSITFGVNGTRCTFHFWLNHSFKPYRKYKILMVVLDTRHNLTFYTVKKRPMLNHRLPEVTFLFLLYKGHGSYLEGWHLISCLSWSSESVWHLFFLMALRSRSAQRLGSSFPPGP